MLLREKTSNLRYAYEIAFSIYLSLLFIMVNALRSIQHPTRNSWVESLYLLGKGRASSQSYEDTQLRLAFILLWAMTAIILFLLLRAMAKLSVTTIFIRTFIGIVATVGFPLALGYVVWRSELRVYGFPRGLVHTFYSFNPHWLGIEVVAILVISFLYGSGKWQPKAMWALFLLFLHFSLWTWVVLLGGGSGNILLWPGYSWTPLTRRHPSLIYPLLGFVVSLVWGFFVRESVKIRRSANLVHSQ